MTHDDFTAILTEKHIPWRLSANGIIVGEKYCGGVHLCRLTALPENHPVTFSNDGGVCLCRLTALPENHPVTFSNDGGVHLCRLTALRESQPVTFSNGDYVYLSSLTAPPTGHIYQGRRRQFINADDYTMLVIGRRRQMGTAELFPCVYFGGGPIEKLEKSYVAREGDFTAHGATPDEALRDLRFKIAQLDFDPDELIKTIASRGTITFDDFRLLTGACGEGLRHGLIKAGYDVPPDELPLKEALAAAHGAYGTRFRAMFELVASP